MGKQTKAVKKAKAGKVKAEKIIEEARAKVATGVVSDKWASERIEGCTDEAWALAVRCRELREEGEAWWAIARAMELPGAGDSATTGKKGASRARNVYKAGFGAFPRTFTTGRTPAEKNEHVRSMQKAKKAERRAQAKAGKSVISADMPDEEVADMLKGRKIRWWVQSEINPDGREMEAAVHPKAPMYIYEEHGERIIEFREQHRRAPHEVRWMPAQIRVVRLRQIFSVR